MPHLRAVVFDAGETLFDETRMWEGWADWLGIPRLTLMAVLGTVIAEGRHHLDVFQILRPEIEVEEERRARLEKGERVAFDLADLYPDALRTITTLKEEGYKVGVVGNQRSGFTSCLLDAGVDLDLLSTSGDIGAEKPDPRFFGGIQRALAIPPGEIAYVVDRMDNDVRPAESVGMIGVLIRRGPWAFIQSAREPAPLHSVDSLDELPDLLRSLT